MNNIKIFLVFEKEKLNIYFMNCKLIWYIFDFFILGNGYCRSEGIVAVYL